MSERVVSWSLDWTILQSLDEAQRLVECAQVNDVDSRLLAQRMRSLQQPYTENLFVLSERLVGTMLFLGDMGIHQALVTKRHPQTDDVDGDNRPTVLFQPYVDVVVGPSDSRSSTNQLNPFLEAMTTLGGSIDSYAIISDHPVDIHAARGIGAYAIGINLQEMPGRTQAFEQAQADAIVTTVDGVYGPLLNRYLADEVSTVH